MGEGDCPSATEHGTKTATRELITMAPMTTKVTRTTTTCAAGPAMRTARVGLNKRNGLRQRGSTIRVNSQKDTFPRDVGFLAWTIPSSIPVGSFGGSSLFYRLNESIAEGFAKFPTGPGLTDPFWVYMLTWHIGLFL